MDHLYLRTMNYGRGRRKRIVWILTASDTVDLREPTKLWQGELELSDDRDAQTALTLSDALATVERSLFTLPEETMPLF